jgi:hypothetical protein
MTIKIFEKNKANEICQKLIVLGFSCKIELIMRTFFRLQGREYKIKTNAPEIIAQDVIRGNIH